MEQLTGRFLEEFKRMNPNSSRLYKQAQEYLPGGNSRASLFFKPHPLYAKRADGCRILDVDDNERIDLCNNLGPLILGHNHPKVLEAVRAQISAGDAFGMPTELEIRMAQKICQAAPCADKVRFCVTGTEATLNTIRAARAYTGRQKVAKFEGHYNGSHDVAEISIKPPLSAAGPAEKPLSVPDADGIPDGVLNDVIVLPWNDLENTEAIIKLHSNELAAVILNPIGRIHPPQSGFLKGLREITERYGIVLIFDEVVTGFRLSFGGAQEYYGVTPDIAAYGKVIGGGYALGAFGGSEEIMSLFDPDRTKHPHIPHAGTLNAHPVALAAGLATLGELTPDVYSRLNSNGEYLRKKIQSVLDGLNMKALTVGAGSFTKLIYFGIENARNYRDTARADKDMDLTFGVGCLGKGLYMVPGSYCILSAPMSNSDIEQIVGKMGEVLQQMASGKS